MHAFVLFCLLNVKMQDLRGGGFSRWSLYLANLLKSELSERDTKKLHRLLYHSLCTNVADKEGFKPSNSLEDSWFLLRVFDYVCHLYAYVYSLIWD